MKPIENMPVGAAGAAATRAITDVALRRHPLLGLLGAVVGPIVQLFRPNGGRSPETVTTNAEVEGSYCCRRVRYTRSRTSPRHQAARRGHTRQSTQGGRRHG